MEKNIIGKNIRNYRKSMHTTQKQLAEKLGGTKSMVTNYETGYSLPDIFTLIKLADIFDVTLDELVGRK